MSEKLTDAEREFEEWWATLHGIIPKTEPDNEAYLIGKEAYLAAYARATERTARRCVEICHSDYPGPRSAGRNDCASDIAKEFGLD